MVRCCHTACCSLKGNVGQPSTAHVWVPHRKAAQGQAQVLPSQLCLEHCDPCHLLVWVPSHPLHEHRARADWGEGIQHSGLLWLSLSLWQNTGLYFRIMGGISSCGWYENPESGSLVGSAADTWRSYTWVAESINSHIACDIQESKCLTPQRPRWARSKWWRPPLQSLCLYFLQRKFCFLQPFFSFLFFFLLSTISGRRPIILKQSFSPGCGRLSFAVAARCPPRNSESVFAQRPPLQPPGYHNPATSIL